MNLTVKTPVLPWPARDGRAPRDETGGLRDLARDVLPVYVGTRLFFVAFTLCIAWWRHATGAPPLRLDGHLGTRTIFDAWNRYDTLWYDDLARFGYNLHGPRDYKNVAFFPLFPLLTRALYRMLAGVWPVSYLMSGILVSNACALGALAFLYRLVRLDDGRLVARRAVTLLALCPVGFYLFAAYSEGAFLLCVLGCFYALRLERWWQAGGWGLLAAITRSPGIVLLAPFALTWAASHPMVIRALRLRLHGVWRALRVLIAARTPRAWRRRRPPVAPLLLRPGHAHGDTGNMGYTPRRRAAEFGRVIAPTAFRRLVPRPRQWSSETWRALRDLAPAALIPLGLGFFMVVLYRLFGDPLWFSHAQQAWFRTFAPPWETAYLSVARPLADVPGLRFTIDDLNAAHDLVYEIIAFALTWRAWKQAPRAQGVYLWLVWAVILSSPAMLLDSGTNVPHRDVLMSLPRLLLMMFPLIIYLARQRRIYHPLVASFAAVLTLYTGIFLTGGWIA